MIVESLIMLFLSDQTYTVITHPFTGQKAGANQESQLRQYTKSNHLHPRYSTALQSQFGVPAIP